jgi:hypothetical protein
MHFALVVVPDLAARLREDGRDRQQTGSFGWRTRNRSLIVKPGVQTRNPRVKILLVGRRTALIVCQAMNIAISVVLPVPVASLRDTRLNSELASLLAETRLLRMRFPFFELDATSVSQIRVSIASTWQKKGRMPMKLWCLQC